MFAMTGDSVWTRTRPTGRTGRPARLDRAEIVSAAIELARRDGLPAVTMRGVAGELDTGAASLYRHLDTRDDLLDLMVDATLAGYEPPAATGDPFVDVTADLGHRLVFLRDHPWLTEAVDLRPGLSPQRIRMIELGLERLAPHPAPGPVKLEALTVLAGLLHIEATHERRDRALDPEVMRSQVALLQRVARDGAHPHLAWAMVELAPHPDQGPDDRFTRVVRRTLEGLLGSD